jgi:protein-tyrosine phosphatase
MFSIFRKKSYPVDLSILGADMHSHILPGIDDGSQDTDTSIELIQGLRDLGYSRLVATPHILWDMYKNDATSIGEAHDELNAAMNVDTFSSKIRHGAEYYMDEHFDELLANNVPLLTIHKNWVLVEFSFISPPMDLKEKLFEMQIRGYHPVLAHPERYQYFATNKRFYEELRATGSYFQVNLLSLIGYYGKISQELALYLVKAEYVDLLGTDLHHDRHLSALRSSPTITDTVKSIVDRGAILNMEIT